MIRNEQGEATITLAIVGAVATASPVIVAGATALDNASGVAIFIATVLASVTAIGAGVGKIWAKSKARDARDARVDRALFGDKDNARDGGMVAQLDRIEAQLSGTQMQTADNSRRIDGLESAT